MRLTHYLRHYRKWTRHHQLRKFITRLKNLFKQVSRKKKNIKRGDIKYTQNSMSEQREKRTPAEFTTMNKTVNRKDNGPTKDHENKFKK